MTPDEFQWVQRIAKEDAGLVLDAGRAYLAEIRLADLARREGPGTVAELIGRARREKDGGLRRRVVESLLVHETRFFRDEASFDLFRDWVLPELLRRPGQPAVAVWSAGCSSGQEPYSLAMILGERLPAGVKKRILATDLSEAALARARAGVYHELEIHRGLTPERRERYFTAVGHGDWRINDALRESVEFRPLNLVKEWPAVLPMDVVFLRNVMIYFDQETKKALLARVRRVLRPGGFLFLGGTETALMTDPQYRLIEKKKSWCYQTPGPTTDSGGMG